MPSSLTWIDHDAEARERSMRILALFQEKESRDELGLGGVRDSFADALFPGTSTIQTRLRYMLFVPWVYQELERKWVGYNRIASRARGDELALVEPLLTSGDDRGGVFGRAARGRLKRLPSSVYWAGLGAWGIRRYAGSQAEYHRDLDSIYRRRRLTQEQATEGDSGGEGEMPDAGTVTWHPKLPGRPEGFPENVSFALSAEEAQFLRDSIQGHCTDSLLAHLAGLDLQSGNGASTILALSKVETAWSHPGYGHWPGRLKDLVDHARRFSVLMHGASRMYNLLLGEMAKREDLVQEHYNALAAWYAELPLDELAAWQLARLWEVSASGTHKIGNVTKDFVSDWLRRVLVCESGEALARDSEARRLVRRREEHQKGARSRFKNTRARDQWGGHAGLSPLRYRWGTARSFLIDLYRGLSGGNHA